MEFNTGIKLQVVACTTFHIYFFAIFELYGSPKTWQRDVDG